MNNVALNKNILSLILQELTDPQDRMNFACVNRLFYQIYLDSVSFYHIPDHRPIVEKVNDLYQKKSSAEALRKKSCCIKAGVMLLGPICCITGLSLCVISCGHCCAVTHVAKNILFWSGFCGCMCGAGITGEGYSYIREFDKKAPYQEESENLMGEYKSKREACDEEIKNLHLPARISMEDSEISHQNPFN